jgi:protein-S-isoprenylcysteine O-methyltransferase Ste14
MDLFQQLLTLDLESFNTFLWYWGALGIASAFAIHFLKIMPMSGRGDTSILHFLGNIDKKTGWIIMEVPILIVVISFYLLGSSGFNASVFVIAVFIIHYIHRALIFPYRIKAEGKTMPVSMMFSSMAFYTINGYLIGYYHGALASYEWSWLYDPRFIFGLAIFLAGFYINISSDNILINLRKPGETGYKIPHGGFYKYVSCPNYFGEILEWIGFAILSWSLMGAVYLIWVALPLIAQGIEAHHWYHERFGDEYPENRKAVIPGLI